MSSIIEVTTVKELPKLYIMMRDDESQARKRIDQIADKLLSRGLIVVRPLNIYRYTHKASTMLAIQLADVEVTPLKEKSQKNKDKIEKRIRGRK